MNTLIQVEQLYRYYGDHLAVNNVSFSLAKGEILGFLGPNGAGKSSTMQMICGNLAPSSGQIRINGIDMLDNPKEAKAELGYLPENPPVYRELTVDEYLSYCAQLHRVAKDKTKAAVDNAKQRCGLTQEGDRLIGNLSKGYQQRVGIAQAILHSPAVIILDEPTVGLDPIQILEIRQLIRELGREHSIILSTHILPEVQESCTQVQIIHQGQLVLNDSIAGMEKRMDSSSLLLATRVAADRALLDAIPGVKSIEALDHQRYRIFYDKHTEPAEQIAALVVAQNWGLRELTPERRTMEQVFVEITRSRPHSPPTGEGLENPLPAGQISQEQIWSGKARPEGSRQDCLETLGRVRANVLDSLSDSSSSTNAFSPHPNPSPTGEGLNKGTQP